MTLNDLFDGEKTFSYLGYTFRPYQRRINRDFFSISKRLFTAHYWKKQETVMIMMSFIKRPVVIMIRSFV